MATTTKPKWKQWRGTYRNVIRRGLRLEKVAALLGIDDAYIEPQDFYHRLVWNVPEGESIQEFAARVRLVAAKLGPEWIPVIDTDPDSGSADDAPTMRARWTWRKALDWNSELTVLLKSSSPQCRIDPRRPYREGVYEPDTHPQIHPECARVLAELQDECEPDEVECPA